MPPPGIPQGNRARAQAAGPGEIVQAGNFSGLEVGGEADREAFLPADQAQGGDEGALSPRRGDGGPPRGGDHRHQRMKGLVALGRGGGPPRLEAMVFIDVGQAQIEAGGREEDLVQAGHARPGVTLGQGGGGGATVQGQLPGSEQPGLGRQGEGQLTRGRGKVLDIEESGRRRVEAQPHQGLAGAKALAGGDQQRLFRPQAEADGGPRPGPAGHARAQGAQPPVQSRGQGGDDLGVAGRGDQGGEGQGQEPGIDVGHRQEDAIGAAGTVDAEQQATGGDAGEMVAGPLLPRRPPADQKQLHLARLNHPGLVGIVETQRLMAAAPLALRLGQQGRRPAIGWLSGWLSERLI